jgi:hypothetical protein
VVIQLRGVANLIRKNRTILAQPAAGLCAELADPDGGGYAPDQRIAESGPITGAEGAEFVDLFRLETRLASLID